MPVDLGGVAISYNLPGVGSGLKLDGPTLAAIFDGTITNWDSPRIASVTGDANLPNLAIVPVHRADSSGPGWDLDDYLIKTSPAWVALVGSKASKTWPLPKVGIGEQLNSGVATYVSQTKGAIGYVEYGYALRGQLHQRRPREQVRRLREAVWSYDRPGRFVRDRPQLHQVLDHRRARLPLLPARQLQLDLLYRGTPTRPRRSRSGKLFDWIVTTGQQYAPSLGYAPLPANVVALAIKTLLELKTPRGGPLFSK